MQSSMLISRKCSKSQRVQGIMVEMHGLVFTELKGIWLIDGSLTTRLPIFVLITSILQFVMLCTISAVHDS